VQLFSEITSRLNRQNQSFAKLAEAIHDNRRLWTTLAVDVADADNSLPKELRAQIFYLAEFTHQHSSKVLNGQASVAPLIEINMAILRGLNGNRGQQ